MTRAGSMHDSCAEAIRHLALASGGRDRDGRGRRRPSDRSVGSKSLHAGHAAGRGLPARRRGAQATSSFRCPVREMQRLLDQTAVLAWRNRTCATSSTACCSKSRASMFGRLRPMAIGWRCARWTTGSRAAERRQAIVPRKGVLELGRLLSEGGDETFRVVDGTQPSARDACADYTLTTKLVDGRFPDYEKVIPEGKHQSGHRRPRHVASGVCSARRFCRTKSTGACGSRSSRTS